jgi:regulator of ribonuclease activity A
MTTTQWTVADICDEFPGSFHVLPPIFHAYGQLTKCQGKIVTVWLEEDNRALIELLKQEGDGRIVVVQCPKKEAALVGDRLATLAIDHHWGGIIVDGAIRDLANLRTLPLCVFASATYPVRGKLNGGGKIGLTLDLGTVPITPNDYIYADEDGIIVSAQALV